MQEWSSDRTERFERRLANYEALPEAERKATLQSWIVRCQGEPTGLPAEELVQARPESASRARSVAERDRFLREVNERRQALGRRSIL